MLPVGSGEVENLRRGRAFWEYLEDSGVPTTIYHMPVNFPPVESGGKALSGMGTPDIQGTPGTFSFYSSREVPNAREITGGMKSATTSPGSVQASRIRARSATGFCVG